VAEAAPMNESPATAWREKMNLKWKSLRAYRKKELRRLQRIRDQQIRRTRRGSERPT